MNIKYNVLGLLAITSVWASSVVAAPAVNVGSNSVTVGTPTAVIAVNWDGEGTVNSAQFRLNYDSTQLTPVSVAASCTGAWSCSNNVAGVIQFVGDQTQPLPDALIANITFNTSAAAIDDYPLTVSNQLFANNVPTVVPPSGTTDGTLSVTVGPQPSFSSVPAPGVINLGPVNQGAAAPTQNISISNNGQATSVLDGTCAFSGGSSEITLTSDGTFSVLQGAAADVQTVSCSTAAAGAYSRTLTCPHDGTNGPNAVYTVNCTINPPPAPEYSSNPAIGVELDFGGVATEQGETDPTDSISITNSGDTGTNLNVTCTDSNDPSGVFSVSNGVISNLLPTGGARVVTVTCDSATQGNYTGTLSCDHNGETATDPATYPLNCAIGPPGAAVFGSNPIPGSTIDLTPTAVPEGENVPSLPLQFSNLADPGDSDLQIQCSLSGNAPPISSVGTDFSSPVNIPAGSSASAAFDCATTAGVYTATYSCGYNTSPPVMMGSADGGQSVPFQFNASYTVECEVREPEAQVEITPAPGTPQTKSVPPGGSTSFSFDFEEVNVEGEDGNLISCDLETGGQGFTVSSPSFPIDVGSGDTVTVVVDFTDPTGADSWSDTLNCMFGDSDDDDTEVSWPLTVNLGGDARFTVLKDFTDGNPGDVTVTLDCNTGLILDQDKVISEDGIGVTFVVTSYDAGEMDCNVTEAPVAGYSATYDVTGSESDSSSADDPSADAGCFWTEIAGGVENFCVITNTPDPVDVVIHKEWLYPGSSAASDISNEFEIVLVCDTAEIVNPNKCPRSMSYPDDDTYCKWLEGSGDESFLVEVIPYDWPGGSCYAYEVDVDQAVEVDNGCSSPMSVSAGSGNSCTIINTVFFEGIPTLSQYGMALMALLMLGIGFVAVRRIA